MQLRADGTQGELEAAPLPPPDEGPSSSVPWWQQPEPVKKPRLPPEDPFDFEDPQDPAVKKKAPAPMQHPYYAFLQKWGIGSDAEELDVVDITHTHLSPLMLRFENKKAETEYGISFLSATREVGARPCLLCLCI